MAKSPSRRLLKCTSRTVHPNGLIILRVMNFSHDLVRTLRKECVKRLAREIGKSRPEAMPNIYRELALPAMRVPAAENMPPGP